MGTFEDRDLNLLAIVLIDQVSVFRELNNRFWLGLTVSRIARFEQTTL